MLVILLLFGIKDCHYLSLQINRSFKLKLTFLVDDHLMLKIVTVVQNLLKPAIFTALYLFTFFFSIHCRMLRMCLILPGTLVLGMFFFHMLVPLFSFKWSKTIQHRVSSTTIVITFRFFLPCALLKLGGPFLLKGRCFRIGLKF